jgi:dTDP-4-dehydrorhamnose 3,5-epimerase
MDVFDSDLPGLLFFRPAPHQDDRGFFTRTYDDDVFARHGIRRSDFVQDSQSRSRAGVLRGLHGRAGAGEAKIIRCAHGAAFVAVVDARPESPAFGRHITFTLDDLTMTSVYVPRRMLIGFEVVGQVADICYSIDRAHAEHEAVAVRFDDPDLGIRWPGNATIFSARDQVAPSWADHLAMLGLAPALAPSGAMEAEPR